jgi:hypothetical protein
MGPHDLLVICASAFAAVFLRPALLSPVPRIIIGIFPRKKSSGGDAATVGAIYPGIKITGLEEIK